MKEYDIMVVGPVSLDHNIDYLGNERKEVAALLWLPALLPPAAAQRLPSSASPTRRTPM